MSDSPVLLMLEPGNTLWAITKMHKKRHYYKILEWECRVCSHFAVLTPMWLSVMPAFFFFFYFQIQITVESNYIRK